jgi:phosphoribosyl 1,2-cyclic phosphodiesterase
MKIKFYGTRGSIPVSGAEYTEFGGNTSCTRISFANGRVGIIDAGTGIRNLGRDLQSEDLEQDKVFIILSHTHWDHIQGFPFFAPVYNPRQKFTVVFPGRREGVTSLRDIFATQMREEFFPVPLDGLAAEIDFWEPGVTSHTSVYGIKVDIIKHRHPGGAYSYRIEESGKALVYCTDIEHGETLDQAIVELARDADLLIHDAQYTPEELPGKKGWGHSSWEQAVEVAEKAGVKRLALFHHDPDHNDSFLQSVEEACQARFADCFLAKEGIEVEI